MLAVDKFVSYRPKFPIAPAKVFLHEKNFRLTENSGLRE